MATDVSAAVHPGHEAGHPHVSSIGTYLTVFASLLVLTVITVMISYMGLPSLMSVFVAMLIATVKASLVVLYFMHLKYDVPFNRFVFAAAIWFLALFFIFTVVDMGSRGSILQIEDNFQLKADRAAAQAE